MGKVLILLNVAGLVLNLLVFLVVVHYVGGAGGAALETAAPADTLTKGDLDQQVASLRKAISDLGSRLRLPRNLDQLPGDIARIKTEVLAMKVDLGKLSALVEEVPEPLPVETGGPAAIEEVPAEGGTEETPVTDGTESEGVEDQ